MSIKITFDDKYKWVGLLGCWFWSYEKQPLCEGDVRVIRNKLFYVYSIAQEDRIFGVPRYSWIPVEGAIDTWAAISKFKGTL